MRETFDRHVCSEILDADLPMEMTEQVDSLHEVGPTPREAAALGISVGHLRMRDDTGLLDLLPDAVTDEMADDEYASLLLSAAAVVLGYEPEAVAHA